MSGAGHGLAGDEPEREAAESAPAPPMDLVDQDQLEERLAELAASIADPRAGLFGPGSEVWRHNRYSATFLGSGRAALLQLAHPQVAAAIGQHSSVTHDPFARFRRTFRQVFPMVWGDLDAALAAARQVHAVHRHIHGVFPEAVGRYGTGDRYDALDRGALVWVHATLWETSMTMHESLVATVEAATKERYYRETRRFAACFGLRDEDLPASWADFEGYNRRMWQSDELAVGAVGRRLARQLFEAPEPLLQPAMDILRTLTASLLPERLRRDFALPFDDAVRAQAQRHLDLARRWIPRLPERLRYLPPFFEAQRRLEGRRARALDRCIARIIVGTPSATGAAS